MCPDDSGQIVHEKKAMSNSIKRTLTYEDHKQERKVIGQDEIAGFGEPVVILGDPGLGKSVLTGELGGWPRMKYISAGKFVRKANPDTLIGGDDRIIIDGLDEIASSAAGGAVEAVLKQLSAAGNPPFILSCREADWLGAVDRFKIEDDYAVKPVLLHLQPFRKDDARAFLSNEFQGIDTERVLDHLANHGIEDIYRNPLTLRLLGEVAQQEGQLPETRAGLFDRACRVMLKEDNPRHLGDPHVHKNEEELLLAAGSICATQLLCDRIGVYTGAYIETPEGFLNVADVAELPFGQARNDALRIRLFQAEGENRFTHIHRVIAEYLGAKWLAQCFDEGFSERRIFGLFRQSEGVPTSLRGLHAWMAHFSDALAYQCIAADPYGVLRYGDAEKLRLEQARALLAALKKLSEEDPHFRSEDWGRHPASGLMRTELKDDILAIIGTPRSHTHLTILLIDAMAGTPLAEELAPTLNTILFDQDRFFSERSGAAVAMHTAGCCDDWEAIIHRLLAMGDANSARLTCEILDDVEAHTMSIQTGIDAVFAHLGLAANQISRSEPDEIKHLPDSLFGDLDAGQLGTLLDGLAERARLLMEGADYSPRSYIADLMRRLAVRVLETDKAIEPERIWVWIGWLDGSDGYNNDTRRRLAKIFCENRALRTALLEHVLLTPCAENTWMAGHCLAETQLDLYPTNEDLAGVLKALRARAGDGALNAEMWRDLLNLGRSGDGIADIVHDTATEIADGDPDLLATLAEMAEVTVPEWKIKQAERNARVEAQRQAVYRARRTILGKRACDIAAGDVHVLAEAAAVYLDRHYKFDLSALPEERLRAFLGETLSDQVLAGFIAVLNRSDLPSAAEVAQTRCEDKQWVAEEPMICGVAEMIRQGRSIEVIDHATLAAVYMAWRLAPESNSDAQIDIGSALEAEVFKDEEDWEAHFRTIIEPQLACQREHIIDLYRLTHEARWAPLAGRRAVDWLRIYPALPLSIQTELMTCALENATPDMLRVMAVHGRTKVHSDNETRLLWLSADYVVDFDSYRETLEAAADSPGFLWFLRNRVTPKSGDRFARFSLAHLVFIVEAFGPHWPKVDRPKGVTTGVCNPWDASEFIEHTIYAIASRPSAEATEALQSLIANHAPSYANTARHALTLQRKARRDFEYAAPTVAQLQAVMGDALPETIDDMRAYFADRIETVQERMRGSNTDMWEAYWANDRPKGENFCRNRLIEHISGQLPQSIRFQPEMHMPGQTRADIAAIRNSIGLPVEIKGQWHADVWNAANDQLDANYTRDWHAEGRGVYIVLWFGNVPGKLLPRHPEGLDLPNTPQVLRQMLIDRIPKARRSQIDVFVIDVTAHAKVT